MDTESLLDEIAAVLPPVSKPLSEHITFHPAGCCQCDFLREDLEKYTEPTLPDEAIRALHQELSLLSAQATRWVLPSYLRRCITMDTYDAVETEFLIYNLGPKAEYQADTRDRLKELSVPQLNVLLHFLEWCALHPEWPSYCGEDIATAQAFVGTLVNDRQRPDTSLERKDEG